MLEYLKKFGYAQPEISEYVRDNIVVAKEIDIAPHVKEKIPFWCLRVGGEQWMTYDFVYHSSAYEVFSHYSLATGHCILTGLGFGVREQWLLNKKEVTKLTVIEKNIEVIEYHQYKKSPFLEHVEIIHADADQYKGKCNSLLLDHYENINNRECLNSVKKVSLNIDCDLLWFWPIEMIISDKDFKTYDKNAKNEYNEIKLKYGLHKLPDLTEEELFKFIATFHAKDLSDELRKEIFGIDFFEKNV